MTPRYLDAMIETSRRNLGLDTIDIYYLHNPETQLAAVTRAEFRERIKAAFDLLELKVNEGKINWYGTATWNCYRVAADQREYVSLAEVAEIAQEIGGPEHHFKVIQLPYNLAMPEALTLANQKMTNGRMVNALAAADMLNIAICASASLLQGQLTRGLPQVIGEALDGMESDAQRALQFVRSTPGIAVALAGMSSARHVIENLAAVKYPPAPFDAFMKLFKRED
jgi:aryl-alcohol dehydrogenase-like predicted oxidoreductase